MRAALGFNDALVGIGGRNDEPEIAVYSIQKAIQVLMDTNDWDYEEAREYFNFNVLNSCPGDDAPLWIDEEGAQVEDFREEFAGNEPEMSQKQDAKP